MLAGKYVYYLYMHIATVESCNLWALTLNLIFWQRVGNTKVCDNWIYPAELTLEKLRAIKISNSSNAVV